MALAGNERQYAARARMAGKESVSVSPMGDMMPPVRAWLAKKRDQMIPLLSHAARARVDESFVPNWGSFDRLFNRRRESKERTPKATKEQRKQRKNKERMIGLCHVNGKHFRN